MEDTPNAEFHGLSPEARRNLVETTALTPRDKENAGANSTRNAAQSSETGGMNVDQSKSTPSSIVTSPPGSVPPAKTPSRLRITNTHHQGAQQEQGGSFFSATTPSPAASSANKSTAFKDATATSTSIITTSKQQIQNTPPTSFTAFSAQKSPPGTSQVLRKHFQSLGFATPPGKSQQQRLLSTGAVRLTPASQRKKVHQNISTPSSRVGYDGTKYTPSKELLKSTTSSRNQRVTGLQDMSMLLGGDEQRDEFPLPLDEDSDDDLQLQIQQYQQPTHQNEPLMLMDDETSTVASAASGLDDVSFDMSLPGFGNHPGNSNVNIIPSPHSPLTPRMGCMNPVALTLLNDGKEDYNYLVAQDALFPIPKVEDPTCSSAPYHQTPTGKTTGNGKSTSPFSPADVRATLSHTVRSSLARPVAILATNKGRVSPTTATLSQPPPPRLAMRPQPNKHIR